MGGGYVVGFWLISGALAQAQWSVTAFGSGVLTNLFEVKVGDARNDGTNRVYVSERNGRVMEWTYVGGGWTNTLVARPVTNLALLAIGDVRGDGSNRLYFTEFKTNGVLREAVWTGNAWQTNLVDATYQSLCVFIGEGRNDGVKHLYVGTSGNAAHVGQGLWEYTYTTGAWSKVCLHTNGMEGSGVVGDLCNDGTNRVLANTSVLDVDTWGGTNYSGMAVDHRAALAPDPTCLGKVHNDGLTHVVINSHTGRVEYACSGGAWVTNLIDATVQRGDILVARLAADGLRRVYATYTGGTLPKGPVREFTWDAQSGSYRTSIVVDATSGATAKLAAGDGRNDGVARLYAADYGGGRVLEITSTNPLVYPVPRHDLRVGWGGQTNGGAVVLLTNLTTDCPYTVERRPAMTGLWSRAATLTAGATATNWADGRAGSSAFYRVSGGTGGNP